MATIPEEVHACVICGDPLLDEDVEAGYRTCDLHEEPEPSTPAEVAAALCELTNTGPFVALPVLERPGQFRVATDQGREFLVTVTDF